MIDSDGCIRELLFDIRILIESKVFIPNVFTPNGDNTNNVFVFWTKNIKDVKRFLIYDRWGSVMHDQRNSLATEMGWDGKKNGQEAAAGVFVYLIEVILEDDSTEIFTGDLTLVR